MNTQESMLEEIREANLSYLMLAKNMIRADKAQALYRLGISDEIADLLAELTPGQMMRMAASNMMMCRFRFDDDMVWNLLVDHGKKRGEGEAASAGRLHASILMAGNFGEAI
ncbi:MAG TPA: flagellar transcriptional regulator FlhD [Burkholderiaceae bacterium]|nr:flagellar transcriptional regulator FlhD [Burkholderiaceae bacterium]